MFGSDPDHLTAVFTSILAISATVLDRPLDSISSEVGSLPELPARCKNSGGRGSDQLAARRFRDHLATGWAVGRLAELRYQSGTSSYIDLLEAQAQSLHSGVVTGTGAGDQATATVTLYRALGGAWPAN
jgi:hypothetical protein